ncbi:hypothetical protein IAQ61_000127 [Plenodomus lingam]|uniref:uncharacterized protein n=1 Tax=Leptosphaeria maculans TaxID=5022 RepID=UPI0033330AED|nr:hypothetical protein IAQ61_000127 [Plenodomus lingam]
MESMSGVAVGSDSPVRLCSSPACGKAQGPRFRYRAMHVCLSVNLRPHLIGSRRRHPRPNLQPPTSNLQPPAIHRRRVCSLCELHLELLRGLPSHQACYHVKSSKNMHYLGKCGPSPGTFLRIFETWGPSDQWTSCHSPCQPKFIEETWGVEMRSTVLFS